MIDLTTTNEIVKQRALGVSYEGITNLVGVSKPTVIKICTDRAEEITKAKEIASIISRNDIASSITERRLAYSQLWTKAINELRRRDFSEMSTSELMKIATSAERSLDALETKDIPLDDVILPRMGIARATEILEKFTVS